jgi:hypothetical protein
VRPYWARKGRRGRGTSDTAQRHCISPFLLFCILTSLSCSALLCSALLCSAQRPLRPDCRPPYGLRQRTSKTKLCYRICEDVRGRPFLPAPLSACLCVAAPAPRGRISAGLSSLGPAAIPSVNSIGRDCTALRIRSVASPPVNPRHSLPAPPPPVHCSSAPLSRRLPPRGPLPC